MKEETKYKIDEIVFCNGLVAKVESISTIVGTDKPLYSLVSVEDQELSCSVGEEEIEKYNGEEIDQSEALSTAHFESYLIAKTVDNVTDKYYGE